MLPEVIPICLVKSSKPSLEKASQIMGLPLEGLIYKDISLVILNGGFPTKENGYDQKMLMLAAINHGKVINAFMSDFTLIPFRFNTKFESVSHAKNWMSKNYGHIKEELTCLMDKIEMRIWIRDDFKSITNSTTQLEKKTHSPGTSYMQKKMGAYSKEKQVENFALQLANTINEKGKNTFNRFKMKVSSKDQIFDVKIDFFLNGTDITAFKNLVSTSLATHKFKQLHITGPWPVYHFLSEKFTKRIS